MTATRWLCFSLLAAPLACAAPAPPLARDAAPAPPLGRTIVAPMNLGSEAPAELRGREATVFGEMLSFLAERDRPLAVVHAEDAEELWQEAAEEAAAPREAAARFARRLAEDVDFQVLVLPALVVRRARVAGHQVWWDGARRPLPVRGAPPAAVDDVLEGVTFQGYTGSIAAASLYVALLDRQGRVLYEGLSGLDVIQELHGRARPVSEWALAPHRAPLADAAELREGIARAFAHRSPTSAFASR